MDTQTQNYRHRMIHNNDRPMNRVLSIYALDELKIEWDRWFNLQKKQYDRILLSAKICTEKDNIQGISKIDFIYYKTMYV